MHEHGYQCFYPKNLQYPPLPPPPIQSLIAYACRQPGRTGTSLPPEMHHFRWEEEPASRRAAWGTGLGHGPGPGLLTRVGGKFSVFFYNHPRRRKQLQRTSPPSANRDYRVCCLCSRLQRPKLCRDMDLGLVT